MATRTFPPMETDRGLRSSLGWLAVGFLLLGAVSILVPAAATLAATLLIAAALLFWGGLGFWLSMSMRDLPEWKLSAGAFALVAILGLVFLVYPGVGAEVMTLFVVAGFLIEGVFTILFALRLSHLASGWVWMAASGAASLTLGLVVLIGWPGTASWLLGLLLGVNFLTTGAALFVLRSTARPAAR